MKIAELVHRDVTRRRQKKLSARDQERAGELSWPNREGGSGGAGDRRSPREHRATEGIRAGGEWSTIPERDGIQRGQGQPEIAHGMPPVRAKWAQ